jgi:hypothetical protein
MPRTLGRYGESGESGWTEFTPHASTQVFYVSSTHPSRSDAGGNPGTDPDTPLETINRAFTLAPGTVASKSPSWVLLAEGDSFTGDADAFGRAAGSTSNKQWGVRSGLSVDDPFLFSSYNPNKVGLNADNPRGTERAAPPVLDVTNTASTFAGIITNDNGFPDLNTMGHIAVVSIDILGRNSSPILYPGDYDDTKGRTGISLPYNMNQTTVLFEDVHMIGAAFSLSSRDNNKSIIVRRCSISYCGGVGLFASSNPYSLIEECSFIHNGWSGTGDPDNPDQLTRSTSNQNVYTNAEEGRQQRRIIRGCFSYEGGGTGLRNRQGGAMYDNLCVDDDVGIEMTASNTNHVPQGWAVDYRCNDNVILGMGHTSGKGIWFPTGVTGLRGPHGCHIYRNLIAGTNMGIDMADEHTVDSDNVIVRMGTSALTSGITGSPVTSTAGMPDSTYDLTDYATGHMGLADLATFLTNRRLQRRYNFDQRYMPWYINNIIRPNYSMSGSIDNRPAYVHAGATALRARW